jgi:aryl-alcohol dehydrogenase-like predicted oxidoreductase
VSIPELMQSLNDMVSAGKILYLGVSDTPSWIVAKANQYARDHALRQFVVYQGEWSAAKRDFEREIIPMCADEGMGICPWGALGGGKFKSDEARQKSGGRAGEATEQQIKISKALEKLAKEKYAAITGVALAYVMHKAPYVFPICGGRSVEHLKGNIDALSLQLLDEEIQEIDDAWPFDAGFPMTFFTQSSAPAKGPADVVLAREGGQFDYVEAIKPITPKSK